MYYIFLFIFRKIRIFQKKADVWRGLHYVQVECLRWRKITDGNEAQIWFLSSKDWPLRIRVGQVRRLQSHQSSKGNRWVGIYIGFWGWCDLFSGIIACPRLSLLLCYPMKGLWRPWGRGKARLRRAYQTLEVWGMCQFERWGSWIDTMLV